MAEAWLVALAVVLVAVAGLLTMAEAAIGRVSRAQVEHARKNGRRQAERLLAVLADRPRYVNVLLFTSTVALTTATVIVGYLCIDSPLTADAGSALWGVLIAVLVMVVGSYVVVGVAGRTLGRQHSLAIALSAARSARVLAVVLGPVTALLITIGNALTPGRGYREGPFATQAELRELVDLAEADDVIEDDERQMIHSALELGDTYAREVMVPRTEMVVIERGSTLRQALSLGLRSGFSRIPVVGENVDDIVGVVYLKDVTRRVFEHHDAEQSERVDSLMRPAHFVPDSKAADELLRDLQSARVHLAIVVDEYGGTAGLVTIEDILEEIVGEIADEYDNEVPEVTELARGAFRVLGRLHVDDLAELLGVEIDSDAEGVETVTGLLGKRMGRVPIPGATVEIGGWRLTAEQGTGRRNRIGTVLVQRAEPPSDVADD